MQAESINDLIERGSLGAEGARRLRSRTSTSVVETVRRRASRSRHAPVRYNSSEEEVEAMKVFVSSVSRDYEQYRAVARDAIEALDHVAVVMELTHHASSSSPREECFSEIEDSDVLVLLLGERYGEPQASGKSATHEEWEHAGHLGMKILVFVEEVADREVAQERFLDELGSWEEGSFWGAFTAPTDLVTKIVKALRSLDDRASTTALDVLESLPPDCRERIESLRESSPAAADRMMGLLLDPASRQPGALSRLSDDPPDWLAEGGYAAWEAIGDFLDAHDLPGSGSIQRRAIEAGSPRAALYLIRQAIAAADDGDDERADGLLAEMPSDHPVLGVARCRVENNPSAAVEAILRAGLHDSADSNLARFSIVTLVWAYWRLRRFDLATRVLQKANHRFEDRARLLFHQTNTTLAMVEQAGLHSSASHDLLVEAVDLALRSRDMFRMWDGPSHHAVIAAMQALIALEDPQRAADLALPPPRGDATAREAADPGVQTKLARAFLMLGRYSEIDTLRLDQSDPSESARIRAMQARGLGDAAALSRMRRAVIQADDESSRRKALHGLALFGEVDEVAMAQVSEADAVLFQGLASLSRGELAEATSILGPYRFESFFHAKYLAQAQQKAGAIDEAVKTLTEAAEQLRVDSLYESAVALLVEAGKLEEAASMATDTLARSPSTAARQRLGARLAGIAERRQDWQAMESHARALVRESHQDVRAAWAVVYALHRQVKNKQAWAYLVAEDLVPFDEDTERLKSAVCYAVDAQGQEADRLLDTAETFADSEETSGSALLALMAGGKRHPLSEQQRSRLAELTEDFVARYPESDVLRAYSGEPEEFLEMMTSVQRAHVERFTPLLNRVRYGILPYGALRQIRELPYAELLLSLPAGAITAIPADEDRRDRERRAARQALGGAVAVDTSVVALGIHAELDVGRLGAAFGSVLVADELIIDARMYVASARRLADGIFGYDPGLGRPTFSKIDDQQRAVERERAERVLGVLSGWRVLKSGHLPFPREMEEDIFRPWDAGVRVSLSRECALWCDDLALRGVAESEGVAAFGTWALYEVLSSEAEWAWLPPATEFKIRLLRARIADVPISLAELELAADTNEEPDVAQQLFLQRPAVWDRDLYRTFGWYVRLFKSLINTPHRQLAPGLLHAACCGLGAAVDIDTRQGAMGSLLAVSLAGLNDPEMMPALLAAARYAAGELDPAAGLDPLDDAVRYLLERLEDPLGAGPAGQFVMWLFSQAEPSDRHTVMTIILGNR